MVLIIKSVVRSYRSTIHIIRSYCDNKSIYQKNEEGPQPRIIHGQVYPDWRKPWIERQGEWRSKLSVFVEKNPSPDVLYAMSQIPNLNLKIVREWWAHMRNIQEVENQKYLHERVAALGFNLAALHFFTYRHAAVRLKDSSDWLKGDILSLKLPDHYTEGYYVEAIDCSNFHHGGIRYEGLENLKGLNLLKWLSLRNNKHVDVWCLDRVAGLSGQSLEYLDIRGCKICIGCINALARMEVLKYLLVSDPGDDIALQAGLSVLEENNPNLFIKAD